MFLTRLLLYGFVCFALSVQLASAAGGGGGDGGGGLGGGGGRGPDLNETFRDGMALLAEGDCKKAARKFRTILKAVKRNPEANYLQGVALACQGKHKAATRSLNKAVRYDEKLYDAYEKLGRSYLALGQPEKAEAQLVRLDAFKQECGEECPERLRKAHAKLASVIDRLEDAETEESARETGEPDEGGEDQHSLLFDPVAAPDASYLSAVELINSERFEHAIEGLRKLTGAIGPHPDVLNYLGYAHRRLGLFDRAQTYYEQALAIDPLHRGANEYLGEMWVELGRPADARRRLAVLDEACPFGCAEYEDLKRVIEMRVVAAQ